MQRRTASAVPKNPCKKVLEKLMTNEKRFSNIQRSQNKRHTNGVLAQLGEHLPYKQRVIGSSPIGPISIENGLKYYADVAQFMTIEE